MNKLEKVIYDVVKNSPGLKRKVRNLYQSIFDLLPRKKNFSVNPICTKEGYFFGFHDVSPFSPNDQLILANKLTIPRRMPGYEDGLEVGYFILKEGRPDEYVKIGETYSWNYHKGCRMQWLNDAEVIYNSLGDNGMGSTIYNIHTKQDRRIDFPIDSVHEGGHLASSFSYERLENCMGGYGYIYSDESFLEENIPESTGLFLVDLETNKRRLLVSIKELFEFGAVPDYVKNQKNFVTHTLFSKDGRYLSFMHRAVSAQYDALRWSRLLVYDLQENKLHVAGTDNMVSHYVWNDENQIIAFCRMEGIDSHVLFKEPNLKTWDRIAYPRLNSDGHQSFIHSNSFITDTYPDKYRIARIFKVDIQSNEVKLLVKVNSLKKYQSIPGAHWACDLHPRMNRSGTILCFDSVFTGKRALCTMKI